MLKPEDIHDAQFRTRLKGYDIDQVNDFLDRIVADYSKLWNSNQKLSKSSHNLLEFKKVNQSHVNDISQALMVAQSTAKKIIDKAQDKSKQSLDDLHEYCKMKRTNADKNSKGIVANAYAKATQIIFKAQYRYAQLEGRIDRLNRHMSDYKKTLHKSLTAQLNYLNKNTVKPLPVPHRHFAKGPINKSNDIKGFKAFKAVKKYYRQHQSIICYPNGQTKPLFKN